MDFRIVQLNDGIKANGMNEHGRYVEVDIQGTETIQDILQLFEEAKTEIEKEKERVEAEKAEVEERNAVLIQDNQAKAEAINALIERYAEFVETKEEYEVGKSYTVGDTFKYQGIVYAVVQSHTSQEDWKPELTPALYKVLRQTEEAGNDAVIQEWVQPTGAHDAYNFGDKVIYNGKIYKSKVNSNITVPDGDEPYNRYWEAITNG